MTPSPETRVDDLAVALRASADPDRALAMAAYMRNVAPYFGVAAPARRAIQREVLAGWSPSEADLVGFARAAWRRDERELQYVACDLLAHHATRCSSALLNELEWFVTHRSWWDTVDTLATAVGGQVTRHPALGATMDRWIDAEYFWLARVAIIHQLRFGDATDSERLFNYCTRRAADSEFFVRKAIGWALRQYARVDPDAVRAYVDAHESDLSGLSKREARKHLTG